MVAIRNLIEIQKSQNQILAWYLDDKSAYLDAEGPHRPLNSPDISAQFILCIRWKRIMILELSAKARNNFLQQYGATAGILNIVQG